MKTDLSTFINLHCIAIIMSVPTSLTKQLLQLHHPDQKISNEAVELSSEFLKLFLQEARRRAAIEVCLWCYYFVLP